MPIVKSQMLSLEYLIGNIQFLETPTKKESYNAGNWQLLTSLQLESHFIVIEKSP